MEENKPTQPQPSTPVMDIQPPRQTAPQEVGEPVQAPAGTEPHAPEEPVHADTPVLAAKASSQPSHKKSYLAVFCAVVVAGAFAVVAVMVYLSGDTNQTATPAPAGQSTTTQSEKATTTDVESTDKAIDDSMSALDDTADYGDNAVSDSSLGL